jgi:excisionase family DNA binding protein
MVDTLLNLQETARILNLSYWSTAELVRCGMLPAVRLGRTIRVSPDALMDFIASGGKPGRRRQPAAACSESV